MLKILLGEPNAYRHRIERPHREGELIEDVEVSTILLLHQTTEKLFAGGGEVVVVLHWLSVFLDVTSITQHLHSIGELEDNRLAHELLEGILLRDDLELSSVASLQVVRDELEQVGQHIKHLMVVLLEGHLKIETDKLGEVTVREGLLGTEDGGDFEHTLKVGCNRHLLVQLWRLRKAGILAKVLQTEHVGTTLAGARNQLRRVDLHKACR